MAGRPPKYETVLFSNSTLIKDVSKYFVNEFTNEREMGMYINRYACLFALDVLEINYKSHNKEWYLGSHSQRGNMPHVDFLFESLQGDLVMVECKNAKNTYAELSNSIGQLLSYYCIAKQNGINVSRLCVVANKYDDRIRLVINEFKLPIEFYVFNRNSVLKLIN